MGIGTGFSNRDKHKEYLQRKLPLIPEIWLNKFLDAGVIYPDYRASDQFAHIFTRLFPTTDNILLERRLQAINIFPFLSLLPPEMSNSFHTLYRAIDQGEPLFQALHAYMNETGYGAFSPAHIRRLAKLGIADYPSLDTLSTSARFTNIDNFPITRDQAQTLYSLYNGIKSHFYTGSHENEFSNMWNRVCTTIKISDYAKIQKISEATSLHNIRDTLSWLHKNVIDPLAFEMEEAEPSLGGDSNAMILKVLGQMTATDIATMNHAIHANWARVTRALSVYDESHKNNRIEQWESKFPAADSKNLPALGDLKIVPLKSREDLNKEHQTLGICIDAYAPACIKGTSFCFSVRDKHGNILSDFELNGMGSLIQHEAADGSQPTDKESAAVHAYAAAVREGTLDEIPLYAEWRKKVENFSFTEIYGYDEGDPDRARHAIGALMQLEALPSRVRKILGVLGQPLKTGPDNSPQPAL